MEQETARKVRLWEQHGQTLLLGIITLVLSFTAKALWDGNTVQTAAATEIKNLSLQVAELRGTVNAMQLHFVTRPEFASHEQRIQNLETKR